VSAHGISITVASFEATHWTGRETGLRSDHRPLTPILGERDRLVNHPADLVEIYDALAVVILGCCELCYMYNTAQKYLPQLPSRDDEGGGTSKLLPSYYIIMTN